MSCLVNVGAQGFAPLRQLLEELETQGKEEIGTADERRLTQIAKQQFSTSSAPW